MCCTILKNVADPQYIVANPNHQINSNTKIAIDENFFLPNLLNKKKKKKINVFLPKYHYFFNQIRVCIVSARNPNFCGNPDLDESGKIMRI